LVTYTEHLAMAIAPKFIRVNTIHPTNVNTALLLSVIGPIDGVEFVSTDDFVAAADADADNEDADSLDELPSIDPTQIAVLSCLCSGRRIVYLEAFDAESWLEGVELERITPQREPICASQA